jgi:hypothetical protein
MKNDWLNSDLLIYVETYQQTEWTTDAAFVLTAAIQWIVENYRCVRVIILYATEMKRERV